LTKNGVWLTGQLTGQKKMAELPEYQASDAKARFAELLDQVEHGQAIRITRRGKPVARLVPETEAPRKEAAAALERLRALREKVGKAPRAEILATIRKGIKY
jgi:prevent-host-death family protein